MPKMAAPASTFTLGDLLRATELDLCRVSGPDSSVNLPVSGAHVYEGNATTGIDEHAVILTSGMGLRGSPDKQRKLVDDLSGSGATALGLGLGPVFKTCPPALLDEARQREFPLLEVHAGTRLADVTRIAYGGTEGLDVRGFHRLANMQRHLIGALTDDNALETLIQRLARLVGAPAAIVRCDGTLAIASATLPVTTLYREFADKSGALAELHTAGWHGLAAEIKGQPSPGWVVVASRNDTFPDQFAKSAVDIAAPLISALQQLDTQAQRQDRAIRSAVLDNILSLRPGDDHYIVGSRASALGVDLSQAARVIVVHKDAPSDQVKRSIKTEDWFERLQRHIEETTSTHLLTTRGRDAVALVQGMAQDCVHLLEELQTQEPTLIIGVGRQIRHFARVGESYHDAQLAVQHVRRAPEGPRLINYDDFDLSSLLLADVGTDRVTPWAHDILKPLAANATLIETLEAYFAHDFDIMKTAASMHLHHNTLRYRLGRIETALGQSLRNPATVSSLHLALVAVSATPRPDRRTPRPLTPRKHAARQADIDRNAAENATSHEEFINPNQSLGAADSHP